LNIRFLHRVKFHWTAVDTGLMMACWQSRNQLPGKPVYVLCYRRYFC
jgi:hypothetical protein